jgi:hypothetical protein
MTLLAIMRRVAPIIAATLLAFTFSPIVTFLAIMSGGRKVSRFEPEPEKGSSQPDLPTAYDHVPTVLVRLPHYQDTFGEQVIEMVVPNPDRGSTLPKRQILV